MEIFDGKITINSDDDAGKELTYIIEKITVEFEEDRPDIPGVVRCTGIIIDSNAPSNINSQAELELFNKFADVEYNSADGIGSYRKEAEKDVSMRTGVDISQIEID
ncbi:MAG: hypothetical protein J1D87_05645 [Lachnospiraceae bacterium]|nr:hypothetical protein [Lachnospiraceae bacterium]